MNPRPLSRVLVAGLAVGVSAWWGVPALAQLIDRTQASNAAQEGIAKSLADQIGAGRGDVFTPNSSAFIIARDPFRAIRRGRQLFQRNYDRSIRTEFLTRPLWGVGTTVPFGHDGPDWRGRSGAPCWSFSARWFSSRPTTRRRT